MIIGYSQEPIMGGMQLCPPEAICLMQGEKLARMKVNELDRHTESAHFGLQVAQPWHHQDKYVYDEDRSN